MGVLYIVSTPIGNLEDITLRALRVLGEVERIACEDTRRTRNLLTRYEIKAKTLSYHDHNKVEATKKILRILEEHGDVALVSDGGTPTIADPGLYLVRAALERGIRVVPLPGASIVLSVLVASGLPPVPFSFYGFLPRSVQRVKKICETVRNREETAIFLDSPKRLARDLAVMLEVLGEREAVVAREVTKIYEEFRRGRLSSLVERYEKCVASSVKGEVVILVEGSKEEEIDFAEVLHFIRERLESGAPTVKNLCHEVVGTFAIGRNRAYRMIVSEANRVKKGGDS